MGKRMRRDWKKLFRKPRFELHSGTDYTVSQSSMVQTVRNAATRHGFKVTPIDHGTYIAVHVRGRTDSGAMSVAVARNPPSVDLYQLDDLPPVRTRD